MLPSKLHYLRDVSRVVIGRSNLYVKEKLFLELFREGTTPRTHWTYYPEIRDNLGFRDYLRVGKHPIPWKCSL